MKKLKLFVERNPARVAALVSSIVALVVTVVLPELPVDEAVVFVLAALGLGEYAQRVENAKTEAALWTDPVGDEH
jgi:hypothetical protein